MRTARITILCIALSLVLIACPVLGADEETAGAGGTSCIVKITVDPDILPLNPTTVEGLIRSSGVAGKAARDILGVDDQAAARIVQSIQIEWLSQGMQSNVGFRSSDPYSDQMMRELEEMYGFRPMQEMGSRSEDQPLLTEATDDTDTPEERHPANTPPSDRSSQTVRGRTRGRASRSDDAPTMGMGMGGYGGMGGASMMGSGRMGYGMMGGGTGGFGMGGMYGAPTMMAPTPGQQQTAIIKLSVRLPVGYKPQAGNFVKALIDNLGKTLNLAYERYEQTLSEQIEFARFRRDEVQQQLGHVATPLSPVSTQVHEQLGTIVDLSMLTPEMPFSKAIDLLKNSVEPPLPIVVLWKELFENCDIEPVTAIDMDGLPHVKLETALRTLLKAVGGGSTDISYQVDDDVIVIGEDQMQTPESALVASATQADVRELADRRRELSREVQNLEMEIASMAARREAIERQIAVTRKEADEKLAQDTVTQELKRLVQINEEHLSLLRKRVDAGRLPESELAQAQENLARARIELARRREELTRVAGGDRLEDLNGELSQTAIEATEQRARLDIVHRQLNETEVQLSQVSAFEPRAARLRAGQQALDIAEQRINALTNQMIHLQPPTVNVIGADNL